MNHIKTASRNHLEVAFGLADAHKVKADRASTWIKSTNTGEVRKTDGKNKVKFKSQKQILLNKEEHCQIKI